jgi:hypothetical protein
VKETPVASFVSVTNAPGIAAPLASCTLPVTREVVPWPFATTARQNVKSKNARGAFLISSSHSVGFVEAGLSKTRRIIVTLLE